MSLIKVKCIAIPASFMLLTGEVGCASRLSQMPPPSEEVRAQLGTIGVASTGSAPQAKFNKPVGPAAGAGMGALLGAGASLGLGAGAVFVGPFFMVYGAIRIAREVPARADVRRAETALKDAVAAVNLQNALRDQVVRIAQEQTRRPFVLLTDHAASASGESATYRSSGSEGIQSVLEITVPTVALKSEVLLDLPRSSFDPSCQKAILCAATIKLVTTARVRLVRVLDDSEIYRRDFVEEGLARRLTNWDDTDSQRLREELADTPQRLARQIVDELFCSGSTVSCSPVEPDKGSVGMGLEAPTGETP